MVGGVAHLGRQSGTGVLVVLQRAQFLPGDGGAQRVGGCAFQVEQALPAQAVAAVVGLAGGGQRRHAADGGTVLGQQRQFVLLADVLGGKGVDLAAIGFPDQLAEQGVVALDYLLKPVRPQRLLAALLRARTLMPSEHLDAIEALAKATNTRRRHLSVHERGRVILVALEQVIYLKAELKYITVRTREREYLIEESLTSLEEEFNDRFVRIHRNALVARPSIAGFERVSPSGEGETGDPYWQVVLREVPDRLPVSRRQWSIVKGLVS